MNYISANKKKLPSLLLVDDDFTSLAFMKKYLEENFMLRAASDAEQVFRLIKEDNYSGFLIDIKLGTGMDGLELTKELRKIKRYKSVPIIAVTAFFSPNDVRYLEQSGFDDVIIKPFDKEALLEKLHAQFFYLA